VTWGEQENTSLPGIHVLPIFAAEINKRDNWQALPPASGNLLVSLRKLDPTLACVPRNSEGSGDGIGHHRR